MQITAADVNKLRQSTGAGMMDCKKALVEAEGDFEKAVEILRKAGQKVAAKRADNETSEGVILVDVSDSAKSAKVLAFACETEPVSKVEDFNNLANAILQAGVKHHVKDAATLAATSLEDGRTVESATTELIGKIGEKLVVAEYRHIEGEQVVSYIHSNNKAAAIVAFENVGGADVTELGRDVAMQIVAMKPVGLDKDDVDPTIVEKEIEIGKEQARQEGKPEAMLEKIALGKLNKFYKENTLLNQQFVKDPSVNIAQLLENTQKGLKIASFARIAIG
ncbi:translation elongation factor Ts [Jiulongibacter sediminis]|jgi:elongation factor Ts|uniref:Elongation factor Ts n=1 Tax=Jiulongibacter sediminis TaxID=1605367 RepID=A0A0N8H9W6_9BACT|nr:translation elongation factor Ts [Jiulongibacter sediminis]KPM48516.1 elongation factor Ts [Jiulongibacter sediminis]TBX25054.1 elongation factor Ts [Jiulongibacter sediminis]